MNDHARLGAAHLRLPENDLRVRATHGFPLLFLGGACVLIAVVLLQSSLAGHASRLPFWQLSLSIGIVALAGGVLAIVAGNFEDPRSIPNLPHRIGPRTPNRSLDDDWSGRDPTRPPAPPARPVRPPQPTSRAASLPFPRPSTPGASVPTGRPAPATIRSPAPPVWEEMPEPGQTLEEAVRDLETLVMGTPPSSPRTARSPSTGRPAPPAPSRGAPPAPNAGTSKTTGPPSPTPRSQRPPAAGVEPEAFGAVAEIPDALADLVTEFYPDLTVAGKRPETRELARRLQDGGCPGCGGVMSESPNRGRCLRCAKPMCGACTAKAARERRAPLCLGCWAAYGIGVR